MLALLAASATLVAVVSSLRWLRVAQREHYLAGSVSRFAVRWWRADWVNVSAFGLALAAAGAGLVLGVEWPAAAVVLVVVAAGPVGLGLRGTSSKLAWTARLKRLSAGVATLWLVVVGASLLLDGPLPILVGLLGLPLLFDLALAVLRPVERRLGGQWVARAAQKLTTVAPIVVAITGSYGKTTAKEYTRQILATTRSTVASPASFNNRMGLAKAVNEHVGPGTEIFVAEMGTYGPGEIADLCKWIKPTVGVITAIGPVHLERFGSLDATLRAKSEILTHAEVAVLNIDDERLAKLAGELMDKRVVTCSAQAADAVVSLMPIEDGFRLFVHGTERAILPDVPLASNLACAIGVAVALDVPLEGLEKRLEGAATPQHRQSVYQAGGGFTIIDDTYNSNPAGVRAALGVLAGLDANRRVVVTPGMVELGSSQHDENRSFGALAGEIASDVVVVGRTNRRALLEGAALGSASVIVVASRQEAVDWVKENLGAGDAVLYENDLPDHYV